MSNTQRRRDSLLKGLEQPPLPPPFLSAPPYSEGHEPVYRIRTNDYVPKDFPKPYTLVSDTDHSDIEIHRTFAKIFEKFIRAGGTDVVMESDKIYGELFDDIKAGRTTLEHYQNLMDVSGYVPPDKRVEGQKIFQGIMKMALDKRIRFHAYDEKPEAIKQYPDIWEKIQHGLNGGEAGRNDFLTAMKDPNFYERFNKFKTLFDQQREALDTKVAQSVKDLGPSAKVLLLYGDDHFLSLTQKLGMDKTQAIVVAAPTPENEKKYERFELIENPPTSPPSAAKKPELKKTPAPKH
jgi:hypothetical protein